ncbi:MAG: S41 family peptidase, partial [Sphingobacterium sp.]
DTTAIKYLENDIAYLNNGLITTEILKMHQEKLKKSKGIILDCRNYPKEFLVFKLTPYLLPESTSFVKFTKTNNQNLGDFVFTEELKVGDHNPDYFKGKVAILINENTQSSAEYHVMAYQTAPKAQIFGSQTAGADGNVSQFILPGGLYTMISGIGVYYPDGRETQRVGIAPDQVVKPSIIGIRAGRDEVLEEAIKFLK